MTGWAYFSKLSSPIFSFFLLFIFFEGIVFRQIYDFLPFISQCEKQIEVAARSACNFLYSGPIRSIFFHLPALCQPLFIPSDPFFLARQWEATNTSLLHNPAIRKDIFFQFL